MSNLHTDPSTTTTKDPLTNVLEEIRGLGTRLDGLENRLDHLAKRLDAPDPPRKPPPALALRSDGKVLLSVLHVAGADIAGRERWEGVVLFEPEAKDVFDAMSGSAEDIAGHVAGRILWHGRKGEEESGEGGGGAQG